MTEILEAPAPVMDTGLRLTAAQTMAAEALKESAKIAGEYRRRVLDLEGEVSVMRMVLTHKDGELLALRAERDVSVELLREHFSLYRDLMEMTPPQ